MTKLDEFKKDLQKVLQKHGAGKYLTAISMGGQTLVFGEGESRDLAWLLLKAQAEVSKRIENWD